MYQTSQAENGIRLKGYLLESNSQKSPSIIISLTQSGDQEKFLLEVEGGSKPSFHSVEPCEVNAWQIPNVEVVATGWLCPHHISFGVAVYSVTANHKHKYEVAFKIDDYFRRIEKRYVVYDIEHF